MKTGDCVKEISGIHAGQITSVNVSPDAYQILTCSRDNTLKVIDLRTFSVLKTFSSDDLTIGMNHINACFSSDGAFAAVGSNNGSVFVFDVIGNKDTKGVLAGELKHHSYLTLSINPNY